MEVAKELVVKIGHLQEKGELGPLADLVASLSEHSFSSDDLINSGLSKLVAKLRKHEDSRVSEVALEWVNQCKAMMVADKRPADAKSAPAASGAAAAPSATGAEPSALTVKLPAAAAPPAGSSWIPANAPDGMTRKAALSKLSEVFGKVVSEYEHYKLSRDEVEGVEPAAIAAEIEACMRNKLGPGSEVKYKNKLRSLLFNLKDTKNTELVTRVLCGSLTAEQLVTMDPKDMASSETKKWREQVNEHKKMELMDNLSYQRYAYKDRELPDGLFECPKCKSKKTQYSEKQTRSADEPTTKFCHCVMCDYRWKFC